MASPISYVWYANFVRNMFNAYSIFHPMLSMNKRKITEVGKSKAGYIYMTQNNKQA
jgi:hypothetical protein